jgi:hypothetical protein
MRFQLVKISAIFTGWLLVLIAAAAFGQNAQEPQPLPEALIAPVIHEHAEERFTAMREAPVIVLVELEGGQQVSGIREVNKPDGISGPIPLQLWRIWAKVLLTLRGSSQYHIDFYSWMYAEGKHGGSRLFSPGPGSHHILFLREEGGLWHTVGDYPAYDLRIPTAWIPELKVDWQTSLEANADIAERIGRALIKSALDSTSQIELDTASLWVYSKDLLELTSPFFVVQQFLSYCRDAGNQFGRFAACAYLADRFYGYCDAWRLAKQADSQGLERTSVGNQLSSCLEREPGLIDYMREENWVNYFFPPGQWQDSREYRRMTMRMHASAMDPEYHNAACEDAAKMPEAKDIPECAPEH